MLSRVLACCCLSCALLVLPAAAGAASPPRVLLGEVRSVATLEPARVDAFRQLVQRTFHSMKLARDTEGPSYILSTTLLEFSTVERKHSHTKTCVVGLVLRDKNGGALRATLNGQALLRESERPTEEGDRIVMETAVRRALGQLGQFLK